MLLPSRHQHSRYLSASSAPSSTGNPLLSSFLDPHRLGPGGEGDVSKPRPPSASGRGHRSCRPIRRALRTALFNVPTNLLKAWLWFQAQAETKGDRVEAAAWVSVLGGLLAFGHCDPATAATAQQFKQAFPPPLSRIPTPPSLSLAINTSRAQAAPPLLQTRPDESNFRHYRKEELCQGQYTVRCSQLLLQGSQLFGCRRSQVSRCRSDERGPISSIVSDDRLWHRRLHRRRACSPCRLYGDAFPLGIGRRVGHRLGIEARRNLTPYQS